MLSFSISFSELQAKNFTSTANFPKSAVASQIQPKLTAFSLFSWIIDLSNFVPYSVTQ